MLKCFNCGMEEEWQLGIGSELHESFSNKEEPRKVVPFLVNGAYAAHIWTLPEKSQEMPVTYGNFTFTRKESVGHLWAEDEPGLEIYRTISEASRIDLQNDGILDPTKEQIDERTIQRYTPKPAVSQSNKTGTSS